MPRTRVSTTVDATLLARARALPGYSRDAKLIDAALDALLAAKLETEIDATYTAAYTAHPLDQPDGWGDLTSWLDAAHEQ